MKKTISVLLSLIMIFATAVPGFAQENKFDSTNVFQNLNQTESEIANYVTDDGIRVVITAEGSLIRQYENGVLVADAQPNSKSTKIISREYDGTKVIVTTSLDVGKKNTLNEKRSNTYVLKGTMYHTNSITKIQKNIKIYLKDVLNSDEMYVVTPGKYKMVSLIASIAIGYAVSPGLAGAIVGGLFGTGVNEVVLTKMFEVRCDVTRYTWKGTSSPDTSYDNHYEYGTKAKVLSNGKTYSEGYTNASDWKNNNTFQRMMYYNIYRIEVYPDYCR